MDRSPVTIDQWAALLARFGVRDADAVAPSGNGLLAAYGAERRRYHSLEHLASVLAAVDRLAEHADEPDRVRLAAWYHDAVHEPDGRGNDELRSAQLARTELAAIGLDPATVHEVARLVELTANHDPAPDDRNGTVLCDADLWILGSDRDRYDHYVRRVRPEYDHVPDDAWRSGRAAVLRSFLERPAIYATRPGRQREPAARANLERELRTLSRPTR